MQSKASGNVVSHMHEMFFCREIPHLLRALAFNPTEEQIEAIIANVSSPNIHAEVNVLLDY